VVRGKLNKQIAHELGTSERTIKAHRRSIMEKCEARSIADLVLIAERLGMLAHPRQRTRMRQRQPDEMKARDRSASDAGLAGC
jgi:predicted transcriptional regulator